MYFSFNQANGSVTCLKTGTHRNVSKEYVLGRPQWPQKFKFETAGNLVFFGEILPPTFVI